MDKVIYDNGEEVLLYKRDVKDFLKFSIDLEIDNDTPKENLDYYLKENESILEQIRDLEEHELICLYTNPMSGWLMIDNNRIEDLLEEKAREDSERGKI